MQLTILLKILVKMFKCWNLEQWNLVKLQLRILRLVKMQLRILSGNLGLVKLQVTILVKILVLNLREILLTLKLRVLLHGQDLHVRAL